MKSAQDEIKKLMSTLNQQRQMLLKAKNDMPKEQWEMYEGKINKAFEDLKEKQKELKKAMEKLEKINL
jgi:septation ring formation regulator EzrA